MLFKEKKMGLNIMRQSSVNRGKTKSMASLTMILHSSGKFILPLNLVYNCNKIVFLFGGIF